MTDPVPQEMADRYKERMAVYEERLGKAPRDLTVFISQMDGCGYANTFVAVCECGAKWDLGLLPLNPMIHHMQVTEHDVVLRSSRREWRDQKQAFTDAVREALSSDRSST